MRQARILNQKAIKEKVLFYKPDKPLACYNNWIPDMIFVRPLNPGIIYIGEIFGFNSEEYDEHTHDKLKFVKNSKELDLWAWHANQSDTIPDFY